MTLKTEMRIARILDRELARNRKEGAVAPLAPKTVVDIIGGHHLLWAGRVGPVSSLEALYDELQPEITKKKDRYDISGFLIFLETDDALTTISDINTLKSRLANLVGNESDMALNIRKGRAVAVGSVTCRIVIVGNPKYKEGEVYKDYGRWKVVLKQEELNESRRYLVIAVYRNGQLRVSRYDWGDFGRARHGETDEHHVLDKQNTALLMERLRVKRPESLLRALKRRFGSFSPEVRIRSFCDRNGIRYESDYWY